MQWVDLVATYLFALKYITILTAILLAVLSLDDLFIDLFTGAAGSGEVSPYIDVFSVPARGPCWMRHRNRLY
jgi:hypothetical protein